MAVTRRKVDVSIEKQIITGMVVSTQYLREVIPLYRPELMTLKYAHVVVRWCTEFFKRYEKAPGREIEELFEDWKRKDPDDEELVEHIEGFLAQLSDEHEHAERFNVEYLLDKSIRHFKLMSFRRLKEGLDSAVRNENVEDGEAALTSFQRVERLAVGGIDPFDDEEAIRKAFEEKQQPLFKVPGALGKMMNGELTRDSLVSLMGPEKRGKSWWLQYLGECAQRARCNVAYFSVGDMSEGQLVRRHHISLAKKSDLPKYCGELPIPVLDCVKNQKDTCAEKHRTCRVGVWDDDKNEPLDLKDAPTNYRPCTECNKCGVKGFVGTVWYELRAPCSPLSWQEALKLGQAHKKRIRAKGYKLATYSNDSINVSGIRAQLEAWERVEGFVPDVIIIDYADILAPEDGKFKDERAVQNKTWKGLRKLSQDYHACVITATQADAASYYKENINRNNFSEDKRKYAHATAFYALNQTPEEKRKGIMRIASILIREDAYDEDYNVHVGQCLQVGKPYLFSY